MNANPNSGEPLIRIIHPSDFSKGSMIAFAHALKLALLSKAELEIVHVQAHQPGNAQDVHWSDFPGVPATPSRRNLVSLDAKIEDVKKIMNRGRKRPSKRHFFSPKGWTARMSNSSFSMSADKGMPTLSLPHHSGYKWRNRLTKGDPVDVILRDAGGWS